jgi:hypothetical protein
VPASLRERILAAVSGERYAVSGGSAGDDPLSAQRPALTNRLRQAGDALLAAARSGPPTRETALTLLAADALMTFACEALAEVDPDGLARPR